MRKRSIFFLLIVGIIFTNAELMLRFISPIGDFLNGVLKGVGIVSYVAFIYYAIKSKPVKTNQVSDN